MDMILPLVSLFAVAAGLCWLAGFISRVTQNREKAAGMSMFK